MDEMDDILLKAEIDEITLRIAETMNKLESLDIYQQQDPSENNDQ